MVLVAAAQTLTMRLSGQTDIVVGVPSAGRSHPATEPLIGCFIDTMALRSRLDPDAPFGDALDGARVDVLNALTHAAVPFSRVLGAVRPWTGGDQAPLYRVHVQLRNFPDSPRRSRNLDIAAFGEGPGAGAHLAVRGEMLDGSLWLTLRFDHTRFRRETISRWVDGLVMILVEAAADSQVAIGDLQIVSPEEQTLLDGGWDGDATWSEPLDLAADLLHRVAARSPDAIALEAGDRQVTYAEFDGLVDRVASGLQSRGMGAEDTVVLFLDRGVNAAAAIFGALRAGVAYVPVDTELTAEWLTTVIAQVDPGAILVDSHRRRGTGGDPGACDDGCRNSRGWIGRAHSPPLAR